MDYASGEYLYKLVSTNIWPANYAATELLFLESRRGYSTVLTRKRARRVTLTADIEEKLNYGGECLLTGLIVFTLCAE